jgi:hypothetical protein
VRPGLRLVDRYKVRAWGPLGPGGPRTVAVTWAAGVEGHGAGGLVSQATRLGLLLVLPSSPVSLPPPLGRGPDRQGGREAASPSSGHWALPSAGGTAPSRAPHSSLKMSVNLDLFCFQYWGLNSGPCTCWAGAQPLEPLHQPFLVTGFFEIGSLNYFPGLALNRDPPDLCLLSSWDYRRGSLVPDSFSYSSPLCFQPRPQKH